MENFSDEMTVMVDNLLKKEHCNQLTRRNFIYEFGKITLLFIIFEIKIVINHEVSFLIK